MSDSCTDLDEFLLQFSGEAHALQDDTDVFERLGIDGDDGSEFIEAFAAHFDVDVSGYRWYFHHGEEGWSLGGLFFRSPDRRVQRLPITPPILMDAIRTKHWPIDYPAHQLPSVRWDIPINQALTVLILVLLGVWVWQRFLS